MLLLPLILAAWPFDSHSLQNAELPPQPQPQAAKVKLKKIRVAVDAGHGYADNTGNIGGHCQREMDHTLVVADFLADALEKTGRFEVMRSRVGNALPRYQTRIAAIEKWKADVVISIHSDARGLATPVEQGDGGVCWQNPDEPGFSVLWNDEGPSFPARQKLGRAVGSRLRDAGFVEYSGVNYADLYTQDPVEPSGWIDKRPLKKRVYFLRASKIPTVIIETHHALDVTEVARWDEPKTFDAFSAAVAAAILDFAQPAK
ncbi:MAG: N-acetylmuramoyl-L-alanine amidase [Archangium sp.]|nr:N-acetylmuramoyl-L-alanine amidase [Archangium sp.]